MSYDAFGNVANRTSSAAGQALRTTSYSWPSSGRFLQSVTNPEGHRTSMSWDLVQAVRTSVTDPNGLVTQWQYDAFQRPVREVRPDGTRTEVVRAYCGSSCGTPTALHSVTSIEQGAGGIPIRSSTIAYDLMDREVSRQAEQPGGTVMRITAYSDRGLPSRQSVPSWCCGPPDSWITRTYDLLGRPLRTERPASSEDPSPVATQLSYAGLSVSQTDALGRVTVSRRDVRGNILQAVDAGNADTDYEYDAFGDLVRVRDFRGNETVMTYDLRGRRSSINDVDAGLRTFQYTPFGELKSETNARGQTATFAYDRISRPVDSPGTRRHHDVDVGALARCPQCRRPAERVEPGLPGDVCLRHAWPSVVEYRLRLWRQFRHALRLRGDGGSPRYDHVPIRIEHCTAACAAPL